MRTTLSVLSTVLLISLPCLAAEPVAEPQDPIEEVKSDLSAVEKKMDQQNASSEQRLNVLEKKTADISSKLGTSFGSNTIERRLADIERRLARMEKDMDRLTRLEKDIDQLKSRVGKVESKK
jgi:septal ring factor EnvC (AmiA/AmiB activator)